MTGESLHHPPATTRPRVDDVAWRVWRCPDPELGGGFLAGAFDNSWWVWRIDEATCKAPPVFHLTGQHGPVSGQGCGCGVHAVHDLAELLAMDEWDESMHVAGTVRIGGLTREGPRSGRPRHR